MKNTLIFTILLLFTGSAKAQKDTITNNITPSIEQLYQMGMAVLDRIEITGNSPTSLELKNRWNDVLTYLRSNKTGMAEQVKELLISPTGKEINIDLIRQFIDINQKDSTTKISINPDFWMDELKALSKKLNNATTKMAEKK